MATQVPTSYRLEVVPTAPCALRWATSFHGFKTNSSRKTTESSFGYESTQAAGKRIISPQPAPGDEMNLLSFSVEVISSPSGNTQLTLQLGEINPSDPNGTSLSTKVLDVVVVPDGSIVQLDAGAGGWRIVTKTTSYPLV